MSWHQILFTGADSGSYDPGSYHGAEDDDPDDHDEAHNPGACACRNLRKVSSNGDSHRRNEVRDVSRERSGPYEVAEDRKS
jgi:hypothetical protein